MFGVCSVCVFLGGCSMHNKCFHNNGLRTGKQPAVMKHNHLRCRLKRKTALLGAFFHIFLLKASSERKKQLIKPKSNPNIHRCTDSFSKITHTERRVRGVTMSSSALKQKKSEKQTKNKLTKRKTN